MVIPALNAAGLLNCWEPKFEKLNPKLFLLKPKYVTSHKSVVGLLSRISGCFVCYYPGN